MIDKYFSAGNTTNGFVNYFDDSIDSSTASQIIYIKGGSGVGKSTLMHRASDKAISLGVDVTHIHCSSDPNSLDGVVIDNKVALFDATMPHISDPLYPRANGKILDLSIYLDEAGLRRQLSDISALVMEKKSHYKSLYALLASLSGTISALHDAVDVDNHSLITIRDEIIESLGRGAHPRRGFLSAIDRDGIKDITEGVSKNKIIISIKSQNKLFSTYLVDSISQRLTCDMIAHDRYYSLLEPSRAETIGIGDKVITSSNKVKGDIIYNIDNMLSIKNENAYTILCRHIDDIISLSASEIDCAKSSHEKLEMIYRSQMDFVKMTSDTDRLLDELFSYI